MKPQIWWQKHKQFCAWYVNDMHAHEVFVGLYSVAYALEDIADH